MVNYRLLLVWGLFRLAPIRGFIKSFKLDTVNNEKLVGLNLVNCAIFTSLAFLHNQFLMSLPTFFHHNDSFANFSSSNFFSLRYTSPVELT